MKWPTSVGITQALRYCSCHNATPALAAKKEVVPPGSVISTSKRYPWTLQSQLQQRGRDLKILLLIIFSHRERVFCSSSSPSKSLKPNCSLGIAEQQISSVFSGDTAVSLQHLTVLRSADFTVASLRSLGQYVAKVSHHISHRRCEGT